MAKRLCDSCYFSGKCVSGGKCDDYVPVDRCGEDEYIRQIVEENRQSYYDAWVEYIDEFNS